MRWGHPHRPSPKKGHVCEGARLLTLLSCHFATHLLMRVERSEFGWVVARAALCFQNVFVVRCSAVTEHHRELACERVHVHGHVLQELAMSFFSEQNASASLSLPR